MASPQTEEGYTKIASEIFEALMLCKFTPYERSIIDCVFRFTYGWGKKEDWVSNSQIAWATGIAESHVSRTLKTLITNKILTKNGKKISFQKDWELWEVEWRFDIKKLTTRGNFHEGHFLPHVVREVTTRGIKKLPPLVYTIYNKDTINNNMKKNGFGSYDERNHADDFEDVIQTDKEEISKPVGKEKISSNVVLDLWNSYPTFKELANLKKLKGEPKNTISKIQLLPFAKATKELRIAIGVQLKRHEISDIEIAIDNYLRDIIMRDPKQSYASHRYSCLEFFHIKRDILVKYINK